MVATSMQAQDLSSHQWKNRLVLLCGAAEDAPPLLNQLKPLVELAQELEERKLLIYVILPDKYRVMKVWDTQVQSPWKFDSSLHKKFKRKERNYGLLLVGLDGGVKMESSEVVPWSKIFNKIDSMPMRIAEMRKN